FALRAQQRDFLLGEAIGEEQIALLVELGDLLRRELHVSPPGRDVRPNLGTSKQVSHRATVESYERSRANSRSSAWVFDRSNLALTYDKSPWRRVRAGTRTGIAPYHPHAQEPSQLIMGPGAAGPCRERRLAVPGIAHLGERHGLP